ncbi:unnamed protein product [marine sediment metagenome]|uniref:Uncharacterized protein n=1 Tax=marine sediment metagenome TaxID=412755 RepID=X0ZRH3_9ZZZZ
MLIGYAVNWVKTGTADPHAMNDYPAIENLIPLTIILSVLGLGIAWRWEGLASSNSAPHSRDTVLGVLVDIKKKFWVQISTFDITFK